jgi:hypothetical protein
MWIQYTEQRNVVPAVSLVEQEGRVVGYDGAVITQISQMAMGVVYYGKAAGLPSEIIVRGHCEAYCDGDSSNVGTIAAYDPLTPNGTASGSGTAANDGVFTKATLGTHHVRAIALEACTKANTKIKVDLL